MKRLDIMLEEDRFYLVPLEGEAYDIDFDFFSVSRKYLKEGVALHREKQLSVGKDGRPYIAERVKAMYCPRGHPQHNGHDRGRLLFDLVLEEFIKRGWKLG